MAYRGPPPPRGQPYPPGGMPPNPNNPFTNDPRYGGSSQGHGPAAHYDGESDVGDYNGSQYGHPQDPYGSHRPLVQSRTSSDCPFMQVEPTLRRTMTSTGTDTPRPRTHSRAPIAATQSPQRPHSSTMVPVDPGSHTQHGAPIVKFHFRKSAHPLGGLDFGVVPLTHPPQRN